MLSVGVDIKRLGLMVVDGQPKTTAEYIQATSRVGRRVPGLVCTVYNWARPRDLSHYERFEHYHATFYKHVEALSVTPFASRALDRGLAALLVALIRLSGDRFNSNTAAALVDRQQEEVREAIETIVRRAEQVTGKTSIGEDVRSVLMAKLDVWQRQAQLPTGGRRLGYRAQKDGLTNNLLELPHPGLWEEFTCLMSLREVEPTVNLVLADWGLDEEEAR